MELSPETIEQLGDFLSDGGDVPTFYAWVVAVSDDPALPEPERDAMGTLRLLMLESDEGWRPLDDARAWAARVLAGRGSPDWILGIRRSN